MTITCASLYAELTAASDSMNGIGIESQEFLFCDAEYRSVSLCCVIPCRNKAAYMTAYLAHFAQINSALNVHVPPP